MSTFSRNKKSSALTAMFAVPLLLTSALTFADESTPSETAAPAELASPWTLSSNIGLVSNYYARGISQSWNKPAIQGGFDISHASGFYAGFFGSSISERTYVGASTEFDLYGGYNGTIEAVEGLGWTVGAVGLFYPGGGWDKYQGLTDTVGKKGAGVKVKEDFTTYEGNVGLSYKWLSAKASVTLGEWFGFNKNTGWTESTSGSTYVELNALVPLPFWGVNLIGHVGRTDIKGELSKDPLFANANGANIVETKADLTDYKIGLTKAFEIAGSTGWNGGLYYVGGTNGGKNGYWGTRGYGGSSFTTTAGSKDLTDDTLILTLVRSF
ncbi:MAG: TorF family putative porin [Methylotenera sp.]|uniref:TorF family putative porin n=1 Tax=Methylotenera sp. TaxID=2051956 RepID=UPI002487CB20|nr:TorF family putative porin [Methylotenera sp.]MDI1309978.1 TorF family putative porin [Methylotenera sp.]